MTAGGRDGYPVREFGPGLGDRHGTTGRSGTLPLGASYRRLDNVAGVPTLRTATVSAGSVPAAEARVVIAPSLIGVCRSDLRELTGERHGRADFGHEIVAEVVGSHGPSGIPAPGERVIFDPHPALTARTSGFAELVELCGTGPAVRAALRALPAHVPSPRAVLTEPLACACHCLGRLDAVAAALELPPDEPVLVVGAGLAGTLMATVLYTRGVPTRLVNRSRPRLDFLAERDVLPRESLGSLGSLGAGDRVDRLILATASADPAGLDAALELLRPGGLLVLYAGTRPGPGMRGLDLDRLRRAERVGRIPVSGGHVRVIGTHGALPRDFAEALSVLSEHHPAGPGGRPPGAALERLLTDRLELDRAARELPGFARTGFIGKPVVVPA
ncbi:FAD-dependent monooxygenase [Embleya sp. AB8]|uniref:FAD-dependent monooxygenase n=1 Tax=Embleya sp. AB8 TaxID=3156304 RepID=UPI003C74CAF3